MIADIMTRFQAIIKELFIGCRKLNISLVFITQSYFSVPKDVRLNTTHYFIICYVMLCILYFDLACNSPI